MLRWYVATTQRAAGAQGFGIIWTAEEFDCESEAQAYAASALARGLRVEAGTLPGIAPACRISWRDAMNWAQSTKALERCCVNSDSFSGEGSFDDALPTLNPPASTPLGAA